MEQGDANTVVGNEQVVQNHYGVDWWQSLGSESTDTQELIRRQAREGTHALITTQNTRTAHTLCQSSDELIGTGIESFGGSALPFHRQKNNYSG